VVRASVHTVAALAIARYSRRSRRRSAVRSHTMANMMTVAARAAIAKYSWTRYAVAVGST